MKPQQKAFDTAVILYSGGTTGKPKGIELSNFNLIANGTQISAWANLNQEDKILAILPIFHGFGQYDIARIIQKKGIPTLFIEADMTDERKFAHAQVENRIDSFMEVLSQIKG
ncbi:MAG: AMP-binding protein [Desulfurella sp.]|uniref:AMP-binding protein n=1 Tax=Desulfurella sp. TaxID=1962857 RepID=UPI003D12A0B0